MKTIAIIAVLICCVLMFIVRRTYKAGLLVLGTMAFTLVRVPAVPLHSANMLLAVSFILSELNNIRHLFKEAKGTVVWRLTGLSIIMALITIVTSPHLSGQNIRYFVQSELLFKYFALLYAFWGFKDEETIKPVLKITVLGLAILTAFGIVNYVTKSADFVSTMMADLEETGLGVTGSDAGAKFTYSDRFRVQSMFANPFDYGYICTLALLLHSYAYSNKLEKIRPFMMATACALFGIVTCGCRTIIFCTILGISIYALLAFKPTKTVRIILLSLLLIPIAYQTFPPFQEQVDKMMTMFDKNSDVGGSSLEMRAVQYGTVFMYIQDSPLFGRGYGFFNIDLGWGKGQEYIVDSRLYGLEGVVMSKLLEQGFVGLGFYLAFWITLVIYMFKNKSVSEPLTALGIAILATYLSFANMTGELLSVYPTLLLLGFSVKAIECRKLKSSAPPHNHMGRGT